MELHKKKKPPSDNPRLPSQSLGDARHKPAPSSSIWNWKPLRALSSHVRNRRFNCCFTLHVHSVDSLPPALDGAALRVHWRRRDGGIETAPARVAAGAAEFGEAMSHCCAVYGSRSGPRHSAKYEAKHFLLYASVVGAPEVDLGRHRVDLCRLLPLTLEELEEEKGDGVWTTGFRLAGAAKGAVLNVSFSFVVAKDDRKGFLFSSSSSPVSGRGEVLRRVGSAAARVYGRSVDDIRDLHEVFPATKLDVARSMADVHEVLPRYHSEVAGLKKSEPKPSIEGKLGPFMDGWEDVEFSVVEKGVESVDKIGGNVECGFTANDSLLGSVKLDERDRKEEVEIRDHDDLAKSELLGGGVLGEIGNRDGVEMGGDILKVDDSLLGTVAIDDDVGECEQKVVQEDVCIGEEVEEEKGQELDKMIGVDELDSALQSLSVFDGEGLGSSPPKGGVGDYEEVEFSDKERMVDEEKGHELDKMVAVDGLDSALQGLSVFHDEGLGSPPAMGGVGDCAEVDFNDKERKVDEEKGHELDKMAAVEGLDSALQGLSVFHDEGLGSPPAMGALGDYAEAKFNDKEGKEGESHTLDDAIDSIANEFLNMLEMGIDHSPFRLCSESDPESPRERLLKQFEMESLAAGGGPLGLDIGGEFEQEVVDDCSGNLDHGDVLQGLGFCSFLEDGEGEHQKVDYEMKSKTRAKMMEDLETEVLMREWGLNETAFQSSPAERAGGFGSPIDVPPENPLELPPLAEGLGPCLQTKDGGFLRFMSPSLFRSPKSNAGLIMQVSSPVVVPAEMGSGVMEILQGLASVGIEKLCLQANKLMPLEDITGKSMQQVAWEASERQEALQQRNQDCAPNYYGHVAPTVKKRSSRSLKVDFSSHNSDLDSEYVSLEELAPLAMDKIEALSLEGLRIQSGMSNEDAPSNICAQSFGDVSALEGVRAKRGGLLGLEGAAGLQLLDMKSGKEDVDGLMGLSLSLDEWMRLDAGMVDEDEQDDGRTSKILAAHHASFTSKDLVDGRWRGDKRGGKGKRWGLLGNNFTVALMVQLRDPLRNYEPVGTPMLSLIQVERVFVPPKPKIYGRVSNKIRTEDSDDESEQGAADKENEKNGKPEAELIPQFKITEVHVAGIKTEPTKKTLWGTSKQQQSGSRWLVASGMGKKNKHPLMKSKAVTESLPVANTTVQPGETLWSISSRVHGNGTKWKELAALNPRIRNPNVIFPNQTIRLR